MNRTVDYYDKNAAAYYKSTVDVDFTNVYERFLKYVPEYGSIVDVGCGSGRDVAAFVTMGYDAVGLDASEELAEIARMESGVEVIVGDMAEFVAGEPFDGVWCCASLLHLEDEEIEGFLRGLDVNLKKGGAIYVSVKSGIRTGYDEKGRFMRNFTEDELKDGLGLHGVRVVDLWSTGDQLNRDGFHWINLVGIKESIEIEREE